MKQLYFVNLLCTCLLLAGITSAQAPDPATFGGLHIYEAPHEKEISESQRKAIIKMLRTNVTELKARGIIKEQKREEAVKFIHPLRQAAGFNDPGYYGIGNYVDTNLERSGVKDYNCGNRTYNGHYGTDFFTFPYPWEKMEKNAVEIISAADGIIIAKGNGHPDKNCEMCTDDSEESCWLWNAVYVQNTDGTVSWYGHMKSGSLTAKPVGATVVQGEYLGVVGSSGSSSGPHLHFEVWENDKYETLIDPWAGPCNPAKNETYWQNQEPYYVPMINKLATASGIPTVYSCYENGNGEKSLNKDVFTLGETVYLPVYLRDHLPNKTVHLKLTKPSGQVLFDWTLNLPNQYYPSAWYYYEFNKDAINEAGTWKFWGEYEGKAAEHTFEVLAVMPLKLLGFTATKAGKTARLAWQTTEEENTKVFLVEYSSNGQQFQSIGSIDAKGNNAGSATNHYSFDHATPLQGNNYYRLKMMDNDGSFTYSAVEFINMQQNSRFTISPNPATNRLQVKGANIKKVEVLGLAGNTLITQNNTTGAVIQLNISHLSAGGYIVRITDLQGNIQTERLIVQ